MKRTVDAHLGVANDLLDLTLLLEVSKALTGEAAVDLMTVDEGGNGDQTVGLDILVELLGGGLVEDDGVLGLVLDCIRVSTSVHSGAFHLFHRPQTIPSSFWRFPAKTGRVAHGRSDDDDDGSDGADGDCVPLPLDHFFFCFAGACHEHMLDLVGLDIVDKMLTILTVGADGQRKRAARRAQVRKWPWGVTKPVMRALSPNSIFEWPRLAWVM